MSADTNIRLPGRNIIWCQSADASDIAKLAGTAFTHVILASLHLHNENGTFVVYLNDTALTDVTPDYWDQVAQLKAGGMTVLALVGGEGNGTWYCVSDDLQQAASVLTAMMEPPYGVQGFDLDWERYPATAAMVANLTNAIVAQKPAAIVTHAPTSFQLQFYTPEIWALMGDNLAWLNVQWYWDTTVVMEYANCVDGTMFGVPVSPSRLVFGAMVNRGTEVGDKVGLCEVMGYVDQLQAQYNNFGGVAGWEFTQILNSALPTHTQWDTCIKAALWGNKHCPACSGST